MTEEKPLLGVPRSDVTDAPLTPSEMSRLDGYRRFPNSEIQTFKQCRRKWWLAWYRGLQPKERSVTGIRETGNRIHRALRLWYLPAGMPRLDPREALERVIAEDRALLGEDPPEETLAEFSKAVDLERVIIAGYVEWLAETGVDSPYEVVEPEAYLEAFVPGLPDVKIIGRVDVRLRRVVDNVRFFIDHKSVADFTRPMRTLHLDEQMLHYILLESLQEDQQERVAGAIYNMLKRSKRTARATPPFYMREYVYHNPHTVEAFTRRLRGTIKTILEVENTLRTSTDPNIHQEVVYPSPSQDCSWRCEFFGLCPMFDDGSRVESAIAAFYVESDPLSYYTESMNQDA